MRPMGVVSQHTDPLVWLTLMNETHVWQALKSAYYAVPESHEFIIHDYKGVAWLHLFCMIGKPFSPCKTLCRKTV